jgi:hypothetical protein
MSEDMIGASDTDALAAEYVLGTLDSEERTAAQSLLARDAEFAAKVKVWEGRLGELHLMVEPVEPEGDIWQRIKAKLPEAQPVISLPEIEPEREPEHKPEPEPRPDPGLKPASERWPEPEPESEPKSAPVPIAVESAPVSRDAPPATPDATALPPWPPPHVQAQVATPADATV